MNKGNELRSKYKNAILSDAVINKIHEERQVDDDGNPQPKKRKVYIIKSLKHPDEVWELRQVYGKGFFLIGVYSDVNTRISNLTEDYRLTIDKANELIKRDENEDLDDADYGQHTRDTFYLADFFLESVSDIDILKSNIKRIIDILFSSPYVTPTFSEYAMFIAYATSLRSADLSRQIGAVITKNNEILASGVNDCPKFGGGLYWPEFNNDKKKN